MTVAITGGYGFLGWHLSCRLRAYGYLDIMRLGRADFADPVRLRQALTDIDTIVHVAGVNRADEPSTVEQDNVDLARALVEALPDHAVHMVYANSIQIDQDNPYGRGKAEAARVLSEAMMSRGDTLADVQLSNLFGEHGRAHYNSFVATFCHEVANGRIPVVSGDREIPLQHAQDAAQTLHEAMCSRTNQVLRPKPGEHLISDVLAMIRYSHDLYRIGEFPKLTSPFRRDVFNTYRSYTFPRQFPFLPTVHADRRGELTEVTRSHGGSGQTFASVTRPGETRGDHYHLRKIERFAVISGSATIRLRRLFTDEVISFELAAGVPAIVDMPTMWVHNIRNTGATDLVTVFWADQLLDPVAPDQYPERVEVAT